MPPVVAAALEAWAVPLLFESGILLGAGGIAFLSYAITFAAYYAYGTYQARLARNDARDTFNASLKDRLVMTSTTDNPRSRCYGRVRNVDGVLFKNTHGANKEFYTFVVSVAGHEIDGFETYFFNDLALTLDGSGYVQTAPYALTRYDTKAETPSGSPHTLASVPVAGSVSISGADGDGHPTPAVVVSVVGSVVTWTAGSTVGAVSIVYQTAVAVPKARIRGFTGAAGQDLSVPLIALGVPDVTSADKFAGIACMLVTLEFDVDAFPQGLPTMTAVFRGARCFDPRTSTTVWTQNPAVIARDWALYPFGGGAVVADLYDDFSTDANACDVTHGFIDDVYGTTIRPMYTCNMVVPTGGDPSQALSEIVTSMAGKYAWVGGKLRIKAGAYRAPVATITEEWMADTDTTDIQAGVARNDLVNSYRPTIAYDRHDFVVAPTKPVIAAAYVAADGVELTREVQFLAITDTDHAQHVAGVLLRDARQSLTVKLACNMRAYPLEVFDTVALTISNYGWSAKAFEVLATEFSPTKGVLLTMKETDASIFDPDALFTSADASPNTSLPLPWVVLAPFNLVVSSVSTLVGDSIVTKTLVEWDLTADASVLQSGDVEVQYVLVTEAPADPATDWPSQLEKASAGATEILGLAAGGIYLFRARAINAVGVRSRWSVQTAHQIAAPPSVGIMYEVIAQGHDDTESPLPAGLYREGVSVSGAGRSYLLNIIDRATGEPIPPAGGINLFDVYAGTGDAALLAAALNLLDSSVIAIVRTYDEPYAHRLDGGLPAALFRCGASHTIFESPRFAARGAYVLIGIPGCGEGNGYEALVDYSVPTRTFCDVSFLVRGGAFVVSGTGATPLAVTDLNYVGTTDMVPGAATEVVPDNFDFAGATFGGTGFNTRRTLVVTPAVDSVIEFTADIAAQRINGDSGSSIRWIVTPAGGGALLLGSSASQSSDIQRFVATNAFLAVAGVALTFELQTNRGGFTDVALYDSHLRVTVIKR